MKPNKYKLIGLLLAVLLLIAAVICKYAVKTAAAAAISLPLLCVGLWTIMIFDTIAYRTTELAGFQKRMELIRLIGGYFVTLLVSAATALMLIFG